LLTGVSPPKNQILEKWLQTWGIEKGDIFLKKLHRGLGGPTENQRDGAIAGRTKREGWGETFSEKKKKKKKKKHEIQNTRPVSSGKKKNRTQKKSECPTPFKKKKSDRKKLS